MADPLVQVVTRQEWQEKLNDDSKRYHTIGAWVAIIFDPIFGITDYINGIDWQLLLAFRLSVAAITFLTLVLYWKFKFPNFILVLVPFVLISVQNAFTFSLISLEQFTGHTLNYIALWIGAGMFILWNIWYSVAVVIASLIANVFFFRFYTTFTVQEIMLNGGLLLIVVFLFTIALIQTRYILTIRTIKAQLALEKSNSVLENQKWEIEKKNKSIMDSIRYAERIQNAMLPSVTTIRKTLPESFVFFRPRDVVSGDFYWFWENERYLLLAAMDCTGHGVPGAFMSMKGDALLHQILDVEKVIQPNLILQEMNIEINIGLKQAQTKNRDGMDGAICVIDFVNKKLLFSGAKNPLIYFQKGEMHVVKGDVNPIGGGYHVAKDILIEYTLHEIDITEPTTFYMFSDGFQDQFGGDNKRKFMTKNFRKLLQKIHHVPMKDQKAILEETISEYMQRGGTPQLDDMLVIGVRI